MPSVESVARTDSGLASELRASVMRLSRRLRQEHQLQLGATSFSVLGWLMRHGETTVGRLAELERVKPPSMTRCINNLEAEGLVVRRPDDNDGRVVLVAISEKGAEQIRADRKRRTAWLAQQLRDLTPEERELVRQVAPIIDRLAAAE